MPPSLRCPAKDADALAALWLVAEVTGSAELGLVVVVLAWLRGISSGTEMPPGTAGIPLEDVATKVSIALIKDPRVQQRFPMNTLPCRGYNDKDEPCGNKRRTPAGYTHRWCEHHGDCWR